MFACVSTDIFPCAIPGLSEEQMQGWKSSVYQHFRLPPAIEEDKATGQVWYKFECRKYVLLLPEVPESQY